MNDAAAPSIFVSHGSPMIAIDPREAGRFMQRLGPAIAARWGRPRALLVISAHSLAREPVLLGAARHAAVYDFGGFDPLLRTLRYDVAGAPELAERTAVLLRDAGIAAQGSDSGGLDHGIWTPLRYLFPDADIPVLPLAWPAHWAPRQLLALGAALAPLREYGVLIIGSGSITHNLQRVFAGGRIASIDQPATVESLAFRDWWAERSAAADWAALSDYRQLAPHGTLMHPTDEHLLPFFVAAGAGNASGPGLRIHASFTHGDLGMDAYAFGAGAAELVEPAR